MTDDAPTDPAPAEPAPSPAEPDPPSPAGSASSASPADLPPSPADPSTSPAAPGFLERLPWWLVPALLVGVPLLVGAATQVVPGLYDDVVWHYYWGPIKADAMNCAYLSNLHPDQCASATSAGVLAHSGYNVVNTLTWAVLLGVCILGIAQMLAVFRTPMDDKLIVGATAWVIVGSVAHVLEDTGLFTGALQYFFITPPIYLLFGAFGVVSFLVGQWMRSVAAKKDLYAALRLLWILHMLLVALWTALWLKPWGDITHYVNPLWVAGFAALNFLVTRAIVLRQGKVDASLLTLTLSLGTYLLVGAYVLSYILHPWSDLAGDGMPTAFVIAPVLAAVAAGVVWLLGKKAPKALMGLVWIGGSLLAGIAILAVAQLVLARLAGLTGLGLLDRLADLLKDPKVGVAVALAAALAVAARTWQTNRAKAAEVLPLVAIAYTLAINLLLVFSQMLDAFATALGIDLNGYTEKHVLSARVIDAFRDFSHTVGWGFGASYPTFLAFAPVKLLISLLVIWAIDVHSREDSQRHPTMIGLVKFAIIMVGIGPGVRDFTRLSLGV